MSKSSINKLGLTKMLNGRPYNEKFTVYEIESETELRMLTADLKKQIKEQGRVKLVQV